MILKSDLDAWCSDRKCYEYSDGTQKIFGDPMQIMEQMEAYAEEAAGSVSQLMKGAFPPDEPAIESYTDPATGEMLQRPKVDATTGRAVMVKTKASAENKSKFYAMIRFMFDLQPFDRATGRGLTRAQLFALWNHFNEWLDGEKKEPDGSQTSSTPSEAESLPA